MSSATAVGVLLTGFLGGWLAALGVDLVLRVAPRSAPRHRYLFILAAFALTIVLPLARTAAPAEAHGGRIWGAATELLTVKGAATTERPHPHAGRTVPQWWADVWDAVLIRGGSPGFARVVLVLWAAGAFLLASRELAVHFSAWRRSRAWREAADPMYSLPHGAAAHRVYLSAHDGPFALGLLRPRVVLPAWLPPEAIPAVLRHEADHVRWRDPLANALVRLVCAVLWPWPHLRCLGALARIEQEVAADRAGAGRPDTGDAARYADILLQVARRTPREPRPLPFPAHAGSDLEQRITRLFAGREVKSGGMLLMGPSVLLLWAAGAFAALPAPMLDGAVAGAGRPAPVATASGGPPRTELRFVNLPGTPLLVMDATAMRATGAITHPVIRLRNRSARTVSGFELAFVAEGRATAVLRDTSDIYPGAEYVVYLPGDGRINRAADVLAVAVIQADLLGRGSWGTSSPPGVLPALPAVQLATR